MNDVKHMTSEEDIGSGEQEAAEKEELNKEIQKIPVNGGAKAVPDDQTNDASDGVNDSKE